jgi:hypothetical protein
MSARIEEINALGFGPDIAAAWMSRENSLGRRVCFHIAVGVPEFAQSGACSTCWRPGLLPKRVPLGEWYRDMQALATEAKTDHFCMMPGCAECLRNTRIQCARNSLEA